MANLGTLTAQIGLDTARLSADADKGIRILSGFSSKFTGILAALGVAGGVYGLARGVKGLVDAAAESEQVFNRLKTAIETTGISYDSVKGQVISFTQEMMKTTRYSDEQVAESLQMITQLTGSLSRGFEGSKIAANMASSGFFDLQSASKYVSMAMEGNVAMLGRWIPQLRNSAGLIKENMTATEKWAVTQEILNRIFGGAAQKDLNTFAGALQSLKNWINEIEEALGRVFTIALAPKFIEWKAAIISFIESGRLEEWCRGAEVWVKKAMDAIITGATRVYEHKDYLVAMFIGLTVIKAATIVSEVATSVMALATAIKASTIASEGFAATKFGAILLGGGGATIAAIATTLGAVGAGWYYIADAAGSAAEKEKKATEAAEAYGNTLIKSGAYANYLQSRIPILPGIEVTAKRVTAGGAGEVGRAVTAGAQEQLDTEKGLSDAKVEVWATEGTKKLEIETDLAGKLLEIQNEIVDHWKETHEVMVGLFQGIGDLAGNVFRGMFESGKSFEDNRKAAMKSFGDFMINLLARLLAEFITRKLIELATHTMVEKAKTAVTMVEAAKRAAIESAMGVFGVFGFLLKEGGLVAMQTGGFIGHRFALAEAGEYVIPEPVVSRIGIPAFEYMRQTGELPTGGGSISITTGDFNFGQRYKRREAMALKDEFVDAVSEAVKDAIDKGKLRL